MPDTELSLGPKLGGSYDCCLLTGRNMLLAIATTLSPATNLGFLLYKKPGGSLFVERLPGRIFHKGPHPKTGRRFICVRGLAKPPAQ